MDLETFVSNTLGEILRGVGKTEETINDEGRVVPDAGDCVQVVEFDVAVEAGSSGDSGGKIKVLGGVFGGEARGDLQFSESTISRVKFKIPVKFCFPNDDDHRDIEGRINLEHSVRSYASMRKRVQDARLGLRAINAIAKEFNA